MFMEQKKIEVLLQKYYDAVLTPEEEDVLIRYFETRDIPDKWLVDKDQILGMRDMNDMDIPVPEDLEVSILNKLSEIQSKTSVKPAITRSLYTWISVAASIIIIVSALVFLNKKPDMGTFSDPEIAFAETKEALDLVSKYFNQGTQELKVLSRVEKAFEPLSNLEKIDQTKKNLQYLGRLDNNVDKMRELLNNREANNKEK